MCTSCGSSSINPHLSTDYSKNRHNRPFTVHTQLLFLRLFHTRAHFIRFYMFRSLEIASYSLFIYLTVSFILVFFPCVFFLYGCWECMGAYADFCNSVCCCCCLLLCQWFQEIIQYFNCCCRQPLGANQINRFA